MYNALLNFLEAGLGSDSKTYLFLESFLSQIGETTFMFILIIISFIIIGFILYNLLWGKYLKYKKIRSKKISNYSDYFEQEKIKILLTIIISGGFILLFFSKGLGISFLEYILNWSSDSSEYYPGLAILFGYNLDSTLYGYYNIGRYLLLIIVFFTTLYYGIMNYTVGNRINRNGEEIKYEPKFRNGLTAFILIILLLFSIFVDWGISTLVSTFTDLDIHELIQSNSGTL